MPLLAVYGTLRRGLRRHKLLGGARLVWEGLLKLPYRMVVSRSGIPYLVPSSCSRRVYVEVYEVSEDILKRIDYYEDAPELYKRVEVETPAGKAWIYVSTRRVKGVELASGDYMEYITTKRTRKRFLSH